VVPFFSLDGSLAQKVLLPWVGFEERKINQMCQGTQVQPSIVYGVSEC